MIKGKKYIQICLLFVFAPCISFRVEEEFSIIDSETTVESVAAVQNDQSLTDGEKIYRLNIIAVDAHFHGLHNVVERAYNAIEMIENRTVLRVDQSLMPSTLVGR